MTFGGRITQVGWKVGPPNKRMQLTRLGRSLAAELGVGRTKG